jgi:hypothetical protein
VDDGTAVGSPQTDVEPMNAQTRFEQRSLQHPEGDTGAAADARSWWRSNGAGTRAANDRSRPSAASWREGLQASLLQGLRFHAALPVVLQTEAAECGLASLAMVLGYHGTSTDLVSLRRRHAISMSGITWWISPRRNTWPAGRCGWSCPNCQA